MPNITFDPKEFEEKFEKLKWTPKIGQCYKVKSGRIKRISRDGQTT